MSVSDPPHAPHGEGDRAQHVGGASLVARARELRRTMSLPEVMLWHRLRRQAGGPKFRRQRPVAGYVVDFYCAAAKLAVEIDGETHDRGSRPQRDAVRDAALQSHGLAILHIPASEVLRDADEAADAIARHALPLHHRATPGGPPPHARHGED